LLQRKWKIILIVLVLLAAAGFGLSQYLQAPEVEVTRAELTTLKRSFTEEGFVVPQHERTVVSLQPARVQELLVQVGDRVDRGELLAVLDDAEMIYSMEALRAQLDRLEGERLQLEEKPGPAQEESYKIRIAEAEANLAAASRNLDRMESLYVESYEIGVKEAAERLAAAERNYNRVEQLYQAEIASRVDYEQAQDVLSQAENYLAQQEHALQVFLEAEYTQAEELVRQAELNLAQQEKALQVLFESYRPPRGSSEVIEAQRKALQAQLDLFQYQLNYYRLTAPISGVVSQVNAREGEITGPQAYLLRLLQEEDLRVEVRVLTRDIYDMAPGMAVNLVLELRDKEIPFPGEVVEIAPFAEKSYSPLGLEEERVKVTLIPNLPAGVQIAPGYRLHVEFTTEEQHGMLVVPKTALFTYQGEDALLVVENERLRLRTVSTGLETRQEVAILAGLDEGDLVVLDPQRSPADEDSRVSSIVVETEN